MKNHIAFCVDENYAYPCMVSIISLIANNRKEDIMIHVIAVELCESIKSDFKVLESSLFIKINFHIIDDVSLLGVKVGKRFPISVYYRLLLPSILDVNRVLYLDSDVIIRKDISELLNTNLENKACACVIDQECDDVKMHNRLFQYDIQNYFNSGVLYLNLDYWRQNNLTAKVVDFIKYNADVCLYPDQDAMNVILKEDVIYLSPTYNFQEGWYEAENNLYVKRNRWDGIMQYIDDPVIVHYTRKMKPWYSQCRHPHKDWFYQYANLSDITKMQLPIERTFLYKCFMKLAIEIERIALRVRIYTDKNYKFIKKYHPYLKSPQSL